VSPGEPLDGRARARCLATIGARLVAPTAAALADVVAIRSMSCVEHAMTCALVHEHGCGPTVESTVYCTVELDRILSSYIIIKRFHNSFYTSRMVTTIGIKILLGPGHSAHARHKAQIHVRSPRMHADTPREVANVS